MFCLRLNFVTLLTVTSYFHAFCFAEKVDRSKLFRPIFYRPNDLILCRFNISTISALSSALFKLVVRLPIDSMKLHFFSFRKFYHFLQKKLSFFSENSLEFQKKYQLKNNLLFCVPAYSPRVFLLDPSVYSLRKSVGEYLNHTLDFFFLENCPSQICFGFQ